jgi:hypothetical protein
VVARLSNAFSVLSAVESRNEWSKVDRFIRSLLSNFTCGKSSRPNLPASEDDDVVVGGTVVGSDDGTGAGAGGIAASGIEMGCDVLAYCPIISVSPSLAR